MYKVLNETKGIYGFTYTASGRSCRTKLGCEATAAQKIEIEYLFDFYKRLYKREEDFFFSAFIQKNRLFGEPKDDAESNELNDEDLLLMVNLIRGMREETPVKLLEKGK